MTATDPHRAIEAVFRIEQAKLIAGLARMVRDVGVAEELAQDALVAALEQWPGSGIPDKPGAWLMAAAKRRAIDRFRRAKLIDRKHTELGHELANNGEGAMPDLDAALDDDIGDDLLRLMFTACHPVLGREAQVALTLRLIGGLKTDEIARAFLVPEPTIAQRIVRAKRTLADKAIPFEVPRGAELAPRLASVLSVIYLIFNEGYAATAGDDWMRPQLCEEALRLGRIVAELAPASRGARPRRAHGAAGLALAARERGPDGEPVLLLDQNRARWDHLLIRRGLAAIERAQAVGAAPGPYVLQAAIAACHARARTGADTDWARIVGLYGELGEVMPSPIVELNRAVALSMLFGPEAGLRVVDALTTEPILKDYHLLPSVRGDLLAKLGRTTEARTEFERAAAMTQNERERALLLKRAADCAAEISALSRINPRAPHAPRRSSGTRLVWGFVSPAGTACTRRPPERDGTPRRTIGQRRWIVPGDHRRGSDETPPRAAGCCFARPHSRVLRWLMAGHTPAIPSASASCRSSSGTWRRTWPAVAHASRAPRRRPRPEIFAGVCRDVTPQRVLDAARPASSRGATPARSSGGRATSAWCCARRVPHFQAMRGG